MKKNILLFFLFILFIKTNAQTLQLVLVSDYADPTFGKITIQNEVEIQEMFTNVSKNLGYGLKILYLNPTNQHFNKADVIAGLEAMKVNTEDIIIFYYNGYGTYPADQNSNFPSFRLIDADNKLLSMDEVAKQLKDKNSRLALVIADTRDKQNQLKTTVRPLRKVEDFAKIITQKLFLEQTGVFKIASSKKNIPSYPYFTMAFTDNFYKALDKSEAELIPQLNLIYLLKKTQNQLDTMILQSEIKNPQKIMMTYEKTTNAVKAYLPSNFEIPSWKNIKNQLEVLANSAVEIDRKKSTENLRNLFSPNAIIEVKTENRNVNIQNNEILKMNIEDYMKQTEKYDKTMKRTINFDVGDFKRTEDFKKFSSLKIIEIIK
jgi:Caspase domain